MTDEISSIDQEITEAYLPTADADESAQVLALAQLIFNNYGNLNLLDTDAFDVNDDADRDQFILKGVYENLLTVIG